MGKITVIHAADRSSSVGSDVMKDVPGVFDESALASTVRRYFPRDAERLDFFEVEFDPEAVVNRHAHDVDEVIFVQRGALRAGAQQLTAGSAIYIEAMTLYGFTVGANGCSILNFRVAGARTLSSEQLMDERRSARED